MQKIEDLFSSLGKSEALWPPFVPLWAFFWTLLKVCAKAFIKFNTHLNSITELSGSEYVLSWIYNNQFFLLTTQ